MKYHPDLAGCGLNRMTLRFHLSDGYNFATKYWGPKVKGDRDHLLLAGYTQNHTKHTVALRWTRVHDHCSDIYLAFHSERPEKCYPGLKIGDRKLKSKDLANFIGKVVEWSDKIPTVYTQFAFPWSHALPDPFGASSDRIQLTHLATDILDDDKEKLMKLIFSRARNDEDWEATIEPHIGFTLESEDEPHELVEAPFSFGCTLAKNILEGNLGNGDSD